MTHVLVQTILDQVFNPLILGNSISIEWEI